MVDTNDPKAYDELPDELKIKLTEWIKMVYTPAATILAFNDSYTMKHRFEWFAGTYVTNGEFKGAMLAAGFMPENEHLTNWEFRVKRTKYGKMLYKEEFVKQVKRGEFVLA